MISSRKLIAIVSLVLPLGACQCTTEPPEGADASSPESECVIDESYSAASAYAIAPGQVLQGLICPEGFNEKDYYRVTSGPQDGVLEVHLWNETRFTGLDLRAALHKDDGSDEGAPTGLFVSDPDGADAVTDLRGAFPIEPNTTYIIVVSDEAGDDGDDINKYSIEVVLSPNPDSHEGAEGNDTPATATAGLCNGQGIQAFIQARGDQDHFKCTASAKPARVKLRFQAGPELGWIPHLYVTNDLGQALLDATPTAASNGSFHFQASLAITRYEENASNQELSETRSHTGDVIIRVKDVNGTAFNYDDATGKYTLTLVADTGPEDDSEPEERNDLPGSAMVLTPGVSYSGYLGTLGDVDWYRVEGRSGINLLKVELSFPNDGFVPQGVNPDRVGINFAVHDARLVVAEDKSVSVITGCTQAPTYAVKLPDCDNFTPDGIRACRDAHGSQEPKCMPGGFCGELRTSKLMLTGVDENGVPNGKTFKEGIIMRQNFPVFIALSQFQATVFHDQQPYTIKVTAVAEPDNGEPNDMPPVLDRQGRYSSDPAALRLCNAQAFSIPTIGTYTGRPACTHPNYTCTPAPAEDGGVDAGTCTNVTDNCLPWISVSSGAATDGGAAPLNALDCTGVNGSYTARGYLSYPGDRDYFQFTLPPGDYELNIDLKGTGVTTTGLEMVVFVFTGRVGSDMWGSVYSSFVDTSTGAHCVSHNDCEENEICVGGEWMARCFRDDDAHAPPNVTFGPEGGQCFMAPLCGDWPTPVNPWIIEVTDNGQNDLDVDMEYELTVRYSCILGDNCPSQCSYCTWRGCNERNPPSVR